VWRTPFSLKDATVIASMCGGASVLPKPVNGERHIGLRNWPRTGAISNRFLMTAYTYRAPWSPRIQPALLAMSKPINYTQVATGLTISTPANWLLMYEGSLTSANINENDVRETILKQIVPFNLFHSSSL
jgi:hypothetical protein